MELYTLTSRFIPRDIIGEFTSAIWTERYSSAGEVQLVVPATPAMIDILTPGTFLGLRGTSEIMMLETHEIADGLLTVTGESLPKFLNERLAWFANTDTAEGAQPTAEYTIDSTAGELISSAVYRTVINPIAFTGGASSVNLDWTRDKIPNLGLGQVDANGDPKRLSIALGPLYDSIQRLAAEEGVGFKLYLQSAKYSTNEYALKFATYRGKNRTSSQHGRSVVRLSPQLDSLTGVKEITSVTEYKNVVYVSYKNQVSVHYLSPDLPIPTGFDRRVLFADAPDIYLDASHIASFRAQVARNAFANHIYIQAVDGQVSSKIDYVYKVDYGLGDIVELAGYTGIFSKARITEYIRSQDRFGTQEYPTLSVIDPLQTGYMPDLEPDRPEDPDNPDDFPDDDPVDSPWDNDPVYTLDLPIDDTLDWDPDDPNSDYDWEHDPEGRRRKKKPVKKVAVPDPNPDPIPDFDPPVDPDDGDGDGDLSAGYLVTGFYPDQNNGQALAYLTFDGKLIPAWIHESEDPQTEYSWQDLYPLGWTLDNKKIIVKSDDSKESTDAYPWSEGYAYWLFDPETKAITKLTDTIPNNLNLPTGLGYNHTFNTRQIAFWCESENSYRFYLQSTGTYPAEFAYADGTYSTDGALTGHGPRVEQSGGGPVDLYVSRGGTGEGKATVSEIHTILNAEVFTPSMRWSEITGPYPSPDGSKILLGRAKMGPSSDFIIQGGAAGGTWTATIGVYGNISGMMYPTAPIPYNVTAEQAYDIFIATPNLQDPRLRGYPYTPYYLSSPLENGGQLHMVFDSAFPEGPWVTIDNSNLVAGSVYGAEYGFYPSRLTPVGDLQWFLCDANNGDNLEEIYFDVITRFNMFGGWSPDSKKLHGIIDSPSGVPYCKWFNYDVATGVTSYPLDFSAEPIDAYGYGQLKNIPHYSPNSERIAFVLQGDYGTPQKLFIADADGSNLTQIYADVASPGPDDLVIDARDIVWSFDSTKIAIVDGRDEAPVWVIDLNTNIMQKVWPGTGWDNSDEQKWIYDLQNFDG